MADLSQFTIPVKNTSTGVVENQTFNLKGSSLSAMTAAELKTGSATDLRAMRADYSREGIRKMISESVSNDVIETIGGTALSSYSIGQYFLANDGYYYVATAAITANSSTISSGTNGNCSKTSIAAGMNSLKSLINDLSSSKQNKNSLENFVGQGEFSIPTGVDTTVCTCALSAGIWLIVGWQSWTESFNAITVFDVGGRRVRNSAVNSGGVTNVQLFPLNAATSIDIKIGQASGSTKTTNVSIRGLKVPY